MGLYLANPGPVLHERHTRERIKPALQIIYLILFKTPLAITSTCTSSACWGNPRVDSKSAHDSPDSPQEYPSFVSLLSVS